ncbi:type 4a pilus biogenesis protein PilO [Candidatus Daviesbacteria bacterium]|nr:type 4a pilus biogenesis protein PilO [Candidatus Daviesbacteria bacterium]
MNKSNLVKFYSTYKLYIFPTVVGLSALFLILFVIYPQAVKLVTNQKKEGELVNKSEFLESKVLALESYDGEDLSRKLEYTLSAFPEEKDFGNVIGLLQQLAGQSGFNVSSIALGASSSKAKQESYEVKLEVTGAKALIQTLLSNLENSPRLIQVGGIEISSSSSQGTDVSLTISVLYSPILTNFGSIDSPLPQLSQQEEELISRLSRETSIVSGLPTNAALTPRGKVNPFE